MTTFSRLFKKNSSLEMGLQLSKTMGFREVGFFFKCQLGWKTCTYMRLLIIEKVCVNMGTTEN